MPLPESGPPCQRATIFDKTEKSPFRFSLPWGAMKTVHAVAAVALLPLVTGCLSSLFGGSDAKSEDYLVPTPAEGWQRIDPAAADQAFRNSRDGAVLTVNSVCGDDRDESLEALTDDLLAQLPQHALTAPSRPATVGGFPALLTEAQGTVDGGPLQVSLAVVRTTRCVYDFILAGSAIGEDSRRQLSDVLSGFKEKAP
jgi:hypothetical protein